MKKPLHKTVLAILILLLFWGCRPQADERTPQYLYVRLKENPSTLDPAMIVDVGGAKIAAKLYNGLVAFGEDLALIPDIAESWTLSSDGRRYNFKLKKGVRFFNGREVTASDFLYSFERVLDPKTRSPRTWVLSRIKGSQQLMQGKTKHLKGICVKGRYELEITLDKPFAPFVNLLGLTTAYVVPREETENYGADFAFHGSGTGPFMLEQWRHNQFLILKAHKNYFGGEPLLAGIHYKIIPEDFTALVEFERGDIDLLPEITASEYGRYANDPQWQPYFKTAACLNTYYLGLNCQKPPFNDVRVRRALNFAIDRAKILSSVMEGRGTVALGPLPPLLRGPSSPAGYPYNPAKAKELLREAGYPQGFFMTIYQTADMESLNICQVIQSYLRDVGISADIVQLEWSSFLDVVAKGEAQSFWLSWWADYPDEENFLFPVFHSQNWGPGGNRSRFKDEQVDALLSQAVKTIDYKKRKRLYSTIEELIIAKAPWIFFWHKDTCSVHRPAVMGYNPAPLAVMEKWTNIYLLESS